IERTIGEKKFLILYFVCGFGAVLLHLGVQYLQIQNWMAAATPAAQINITNLLRTPTVGASGAIYGLLIAFAMLNPDAVLTLIFPPIPLKAKWWVIIFAAIELLTGMTGTVGGVAHFAHLGGMLFGFLLILYWRKKGTLWKR
ncbi:MAG: rhomboid family intramembrane serine protease, partial [Bacteroidales bacterium]|nr:rhomboid family intramembrane serine protease [Bacteroidales bacterium]